MRALSLDIWGTLLGSDPEFKPARNDLLRRTVAPGCAAAEFDAAMRQADRDADERCMAGGRDVGFEERVRLTCSRLDAEPAGLAAELPELLQRQAALALAHPPQPLHASLPGVVHRLSERMPVVLTSNTGMLPGALMRRLLEMAGFTGSFGCVFSDETGWAKPDAKMFQMSWNWIGDHAAGPLAPGDVLHVGDNPHADVHGAESFGMRAALVTPDGTSAQSVLQQIEAAR